MRSSLPTKILPILLICLTVIGSTQSIAQDPGKANTKKNDPTQNRRQGLRMLEQIKGFLKEDYYDSKFGGLDIDKRFKVAEEHIKGLEFSWQIMRAIAQVLVELNDSHTYFLPPNRIYRVEYGFTTMMIGANCFVTEVRKGSDAEAKGLKAGDQVLAFGQIPASRETFQHIGYMLYVLDPHEQLALRVRQIDGKEISLTVTAKLISAEQRRKDLVKRLAGTKRYTCISLSQEVVACKLRTFDISEDVIDKMMADAARGTKLILDLRGNGGGSRDSTLHLIGNFFENDVLVGTELARGKSKERIAKGRKARSYRGELSVLIDSESASASEVFARTMQLQKRGKVYGDASAGAVMLGTLVPLIIPANESSAALGVDFGSPFHVAVLGMTVADFLMSDGGRLEGVGVFPDKAIGSNPVALRRRSDPVLAYVAELLGVKMTDEEAGAMYFLTTKSEDEIDKQGIEK